MNHALGKAQFTDLISAVGEGYEYQVAPPWLAMADIVPGLRRQGMDGAYGRRDYRRQIRKVTKKTFDGAKLISETRNGRRAQALAPDVDQYIWWNGPQPISQLDPRDSMRPCRDRLEVPGR